MADITKTTSADALGLDAQAEMLKTERRGIPFWIAVRTFLDPAV